MSAPRCRVCGAILEPGKLHDCKEVKKETVATGQPKRPEPPDE